MLIRLDMDVARAARETQVPGPRCQREAGAASRGKEGLLLHELRALGL